MNIKEAFNIVLDLAEQNVIDDPEMTDQSDKQLTAIWEVRNFIKSHDLVLNTYYNQEGDVCDS